MAFNMSRLVSDSIANHEDAEVIYEESITMDVDSSRNLVSAASTPVPDGNETDLSSQERSMIDLIESDCKKVGVIEKNLTSVIHSLRAAEADIVKSIEDNFDRLLKTLNNRRGELIKEARFMISAKKVELNDQLKISQSVFSQIDQARQGILGLALSEDMSDHERSKEIIRMGETAHKKMAEAGFDGSERFDRFALKLDESDFKSVEEKVGLLGNITDPSSNPFSGGFSERGFSDGNENPFGGSVSLFELSKSKSNEGPALVGPSLPTKQHGRLALQAKISAILTSEHVEENKWLFDMICDRYRQLPDYVSLQPLFRSSWDGYRVKKWRSKCKSSSQANLTLIKSEFGHIFGGVTRVSWNHPSGKRKTTQELSEKGWNKDESAWLFLLAASKRVIEKYSLVLPLRIDIIGRDSSHATKHLDSFKWGPIFGNGKDICIADKCNSNNDSYTRFPGSYMHPDLNQFLTKPGIKLNDLLSGSRKASGAFKVDELETFAIDF